MQSFYLRTKWLYFENHSSSTTDSDACIHLLVVKNPSYSHVAQVCIESWFHFHPNTKVFVHADSLTEKSLRKSLKRVAKRRSLEILIDQDLSLTWQEQKVNLIVQLSGTKDIFIDADLKWNGPMPIKKGVCFFVEEFTFDSNPLYNYIFSKMNLDSQMKNSMKNTSFFTWGGEHINAGMSEELTEFMSRFHMQITSLGLSEIQNQEVSRIVEQLGLSLMFDREDCDFLKAKDTQFDGSFVESSYFGATGTRFVKFGITSRKV